MTKDRHTTRAQTPTTASPAVGRRQVLRRGALLAGTATGVGAVAFAPHASAEDGHNVVLGENNAAESATTISVAGDLGGPEPALALSNVDGPTLAMNALSPTWAGQLQVGEMAGTDLGPIVGVDAPAGPTTTYLVTGVDLANVATPFASSPSRVLNLTVEAGRASIIRRSSAGALAADGKLRAGQWVDISVAFTGPDYALEAVFATLTVLSPVAAGAAVLYPPGVKPATRSLSYAANQAVSNAAFVGTGIVTNHHAVRLSTTRDAWFALDITGGITKGTVQAPLGQAQAARASGGRAKLVDKVRRAIARRTV